MTKRQIVIIGSGIGGLVAALELSRQGHSVQVVERAARPGGKMREVEIGESRIDAGPTVFTMRWIWDEIFATAGTALEHHVRLRPVDVLARHAWGPSERLDLFSDLAHSADEVSRFAGPSEGRRFREFADQARRIYRTLEHSFLRASRPSPFSLVQRVGLRKLGDLWGIQPFATLWHSLGTHFHDPRLRQLFGRYATYCGSSPFHAPATLMLIAHVEQDGVWIVDGGMHKLAMALAKLAAANGVVFHYETEAQEILTKNSRVTGVRVSNHVLPSDAIVLNGDVAALTSGLFGNGVSRAVPSTPISHRSLSAMTWNLVAKTHGFPLARHSVFFSRDYAAEFDDILRRGRFPRSPTVYVCAQDRDSNHATDGLDQERLLCLVNAPANGDRDGASPQELNACEEQTFEHLKRCGLTIERTPERTVRTTPADFHRMFPATGGALYGQASHGWMASFRRPGSRTRLPGLYLAGGSTHPGPGVPMAALSGRLAAQCVMEDWGSIAR